MSLTLWLGEALSSPSHWVIKHELKMLNREIKLAVFPFTRQAEGDEIIIGRLDTGVFLALPSEAVDVLDHLATGKTVGQVEEIYFRQYGETPDLENFLTTMEGKGFLQPLPAGKSGLQPPELKNLFLAAPPSQKRRYHFTKFPQSIAQILFGQAALACSSLLVALALIAIILDPSVVPGWSSLYFPTNRTLFACLTGVFGLVTLFMHEMAHLVAARARGVESRMGISHRLWVLVAETDLTGLWSIPRRERYLPFLAGAIFDTVLASVLILFIAAQKLQWITLPVGFLRLTNAAIFTLLLRLLWQCFLFVRTDLYYVISALLNCKNLMADTEIFISNKIARYFHRIRLVDQSHISPDEMRVIRSYSIVWVIGRLLAISSLVLVTIPLAVRYSRGIFATLTDGYARSPYAYFDALVLTTFSLGTLLIGAFLWISSLAKRWRRSS